jgi:hypothetical protein
MSIRQLFLIAGAAVAVLVGRSINLVAAPILIANPDFETDLASDPDGFNANKTGWGTPTDGFGTYTQGTLDPGVGGGAIFAGENNFLQAQSRPNAGGPLGGLSFSGGAQTLTATIQPNTRYTFSIDVGSRSPNTFPTNVPANDTYPAGFNGGNPIMLVRLLNVAGGSIGLGETAGVTLVSSSPIPANGQVNTWTRTYTTNSAPANIGGVLAIQLFVQSNTAGGLQEALFDNVALDASPVPEPCSGLLLGLGGGVLVCLRRRVDSPMV